MNRILIFFVAIVFLPIVAAPQNSGCSTTTEAAVRAVLDEYNNAWTVRSSKRYAAVFSDDADWENAFGGRAKGRDAIEKFIAGLVGTFSNANEAITDTRIWCMSSDTALVDIYQTVNGQQLPSGTVVPTRHIRMTQVYQKHKGKWQIMVHRVTDLAKCVQIGIMTGSLTKGSDVNAHDPVLDSSQWET